MMGRSQRDKGARFEREVAVSLRYLDHRAARNVAESQSASVDIVTDLPLAIQCKNLARWSITPHDVYGQAVSGRERLGPGEGHRIPVGVVRISHKEPDLAILSYEDFLTLFEAYHRAAGHSP